MPSLISVLFGGLLGLLGVAGFFFGLNGIESV
jgi:hypothetical protein